MTASGDQFMNLNSFWDLTIFLKTWSLIIKTLKKFFFSSSVLHNKDLIGPSLLHMWFRNDKWKRWPGTGLPCRHVYSRSPHLQSRIQSKGDNIQRLLYFKTTHGTKKMWSYIAGGLKIKVIQHRKWPFGTKSSGLIIKIEGCKIEGLLHCKHCDFSITASAECVHDNKI